MAGHRAAAFPAHWGLSRSLPDTVKKELDLAAERLRAQQSTLPILLRPICSKLGIKVLRRASVPEGKAYLEWDRADGHSPIVLLPQSGALTWDRFCTAHELGHFVLITKYGWNPTEQSEYWRTEVMCDYFARQLLVPEFGLRSRPARRARTAMSWCNSLSKKADVPWIQAAKKITSVHPHLAFFRVAKGKDARLKVLGTSLPLEKGIGTLVSTRSAFSKIAYGAMEIAKQESLNESRTVDRGHFVGSRLGELFSHLGVKEIFLEASMRREQIKLSVTR